MTLDLNKLKEQVNREDLTNDERLVLLDALGNLLWEIGRMWDSLEGVNPESGGSHKLLYGTPNKRSMTYKLRKLARYSYP